MTDEEVAEMVKMKRRFDEQKSGVTSGSEQIAAKFASRAQQLVEEYIDEIKKVLKAQGKYKSI